MGIPDRWGDYTKVSSKIHSTQLVAFKCPLKKELSKSLPDDEKFTPLMTMKLFPTLGLVIDLTNTNRYYNNLDFINNGVQHVKLPIQGRVLPRERDVERFFQIVNQFQEQNGPSKLIGVHCTHGLNRTGYFICRYLIDEMGLNPTDAIRVFETARGHRMERPVYLNNLLACHLKTFPPIPQAATMVTTEKLQDSSSINWPPKSPESSSSNQILPNKTLPDRKSFETRNHRAKKDKSSFWSGSENLDTTNWRASKKKEEDTMNWADY